MRYDVIVVGAGSGGLAAASRLVTDGRSVLVIEAGPDYPDFETLPDELKHGYATGAEMVVSRSHDWQFVARATDELPDMPVPRGKVTGGSSAVNGQIFLRGVPEDYDDWEQLRNQGWGYDDVKSYLRRIEDDHDFGESDLHGAGGPIAVRRYHEHEWLPAQRAFRDACLAAGIPECPDHNDPDSTGIGPYPLNNPNDVRWSTALGYLPKLRELPNFTLFADTLARRLLFDGTRVTGVEIEREGQLTSVQTDEVLLTAGAIGSPQLLLCSGVGPAAELETLDIDVVADLPGVGKHLVDHPTNYLAWLVQPDYVPVPPNPLVQMIVRYTAEGSDLRNDMWICPLTMGTHLLVVPGIHLPASEGELRLASADPKAKPLLDYNYFSDPSDVERMRAGVRLAVELIGEEPFEGIVGARLAPTDEELSSDEAIDEWVRRTVATSHHISGTCKMGPDSDALAVVDAAGRVRGVSGLRIADASIFPTIPRANTNASSIMVGERVADLLLARVEG